MSAIDRLRQPEYTGENRCIPCTATNIIIAALMGVFVAFVSALLGAGVFVLSLIVIYLRGYLIPGTPTFTKRYFPRWVLLWFDKDPTTPMTDETAEIDPEQMLLNAGVIEPCRENTDLCLTSGFHDAWRDHIYTVRESNPDGESLASALDISPSDDRITIDQHGDAFVAHTKDIVVSQWGSQAAVTADVAATTELSERFPGWAEFSSTEIARVLMSLRIFIEQCPECDGPVQVNQEAVESCCRSYDVVASACQDCDARLFEIEWDDAVAGESRG
jgi:hypothetical protein